MVQPLSKITYYCVETSLTDEDIAPLSKLKNELIVCDLDAAVSEFHIKAAMQEASTLRKSSRKYQNLATIFMMYLTGERQIKDAILKAGINVDTRKFFTIILSKDNLSLKDLGLFRNSSVIERPIPLRAEGRDEECSWRMTRLTMSL